MKTKIFSLDQKALDNLQWILKESKAKSEAEIVRAALELFRDKMKKDKTKCLIYIYDNSKRWKK